MYKATANCPSREESTQRLLHSLTRSLAVLFLLLITLVGFGCGGGDKSATAGYTMLTPEELQAKLSTGEKLVIVDLREPDLYRAGHIPGAMNIPFDRFSQGVGELKPDAKTVLVCHNGPMGDSSASLLAGRGFAQVWNVKGGMAAWKGKLEK